MMKLLPNTFSYFTTGASASVTFVFWWVRVDGAGTMLVGAGVEMKSKKLLWEIVSPRLSSLDVRLRL